MAGIQIVKLFTKKRKASEEGVNSLRRLNNQVAKRRFTEELNFETEAAHAAALSAILLSKKPRQDRGRDELRDGSWWTQGYRTWDDAAFKKRLRITRETFEFVLAEIENDIVKQPTRMKPYPTPPATQLALRLYRLAHGCTFLTVGDLFGVAPATTHSTFQEVCKAIVQTLCDRFVFLPRTFEEWSQELQGFLENWEFPCVGAWDGFHVYVSTALKNFYSYKKKYSVANMGFIGHNKRFMWAAVGAPGSTHDSRLLQNSDIYAQFEGGHVLPTELNIIRGAGQADCASTAREAIANWLWAIREERGAIH